MTNLRSVNTNAQRHTLITQSKHCIKKRKEILMGARVRNCTTAGTWGEICQIGCYHKLLSSKTATESEPRNIKAQYLPRCDFTEGHFAEK